MTSSLTPRDRVVLFALMALAEEVTNATLRERAGFTLDGRARLRLNELKLVQSTKRGPAFWHELTDEGWAWCWEETTRTAPPRADSGTRGLYAVLGTLRRYLDRADLKLSDVFGAPAAPLPEARGSLEERIRGAYSRLAAEPYDWVPITKVRSVLGDAQKASLDEELRRMETLPDVHLVPETDQRTLTPGDRAAAVRIGGKDKHLLRIG